MGFFTEIRELTIDQLIEKRDQLIKENPKSTLKILCEFQEILDKRAADDSFISDAVIDTRYNVVYTKYPEDNIASIKNKSVVIRRLRNASDIIIDSSDKVNGVISITRGEDASLVIKC